MNVESEIVELNLRFNDFEKRISLVCDALFELDLALKKLYVEYQRLNKCRVGGGLVGYA